MLREEIEQKINTNRYTHKEIRFNFHIIIWLMDCRTRLLKPTASLRYL